MAAADTKPKAGDLVLLRQSRQGSKAGLHWVAAVVEGGVIVETLGTWTQRFTAPLEDIVGLYRSALPNAEVVMAPRPEVKVAAAPAPAPAPRMVKIHIINAGPEGYEVTRHRRVGEGTPLTIRYKPIRTALVDKAKQPHMEFEVDRVDADYLLSGLGMIAHPAASCGDVAVFPSTRDPQFQED